MLFNRLSQSFLAASVDKAASSKYLKPRLKNVSSLLSPLLIATIRSLCKRKAQESHLEESEIKYRNLPFFGTKQRQTIAGSRTGLIKATLMISHTSPLSFKNSCYQIKMALPCLLP
ncbi:hypothetical protein TNCT_123571 [Trichonephila clavata]|uniref:Uncharacterized protein n=1 Tax=Trichonephila clavata TaxID=2740835 RepID=A0A8X6G979_TRICU|nr:hypothetical protein TNCT_123571 [Trichonephila clavata]